MDPESIVSMIFAVPFALIAFEEVLQYPKAPTTKLEAFPSLPCYLEAKNLISKGHGIKVSKLTPWSLTEVTEFFSKNCDRVNFCMVLTLLIFDIYWRDFGKVSGTV